MDNNQLTNRTGAPVPDNQNIMTAGKRGPALLQDTWLLEKMAYFDREVIPERRMHAKGSGAYGVFEVTHDITKFTKADLFSELGKELKYLCGSLLLPASAARLMLKGTFAALP